jgi:hypothetical protein
MIPGELTRKCPTCGKKFTAFVASAEHIPVYCSLTCQETLDKELGLYPSMTLSAIPRQIDPHLALVRHGYFRRVKLVKLDQIEEDQDQEDDEKKGEKQ